MLAPPTDSGLESTRPAVVAAPDTHAMLPRSCRPFPALPPKPARLPQPCCRPPPYEAERHVRHRRPRRLGPGASGPARSTQPARCAMDPRPSSCPVRRNEPAEIRKALLKALQPALRWILEAVRNHPGEPVRVSAADGYQPEEPSIPQQQLQTVKSWWTSRAQLGH
jgi:hypothetical protein